MKRQAVDVGVVVIDVANVCRDERLPGRLGLERLDFVIEAWQGQISRYAELHMVADRSLLRELSRSDRRRVGQMRRNRELLISRRRSDDILLDLAETRSGCVLSRDRFLDKRRGRYWIPERFYAWHMEAGRVRIVRREPRDTQSFDISRKEEQKEARSLGIPDLRHPAARRRWACVSEIPCPTREASPDFIQVLPILGHGLARCPGCGEPLRDVGMRPSEVELKVVVGDVTVARFTLRQGETVAFGRLTMPASTALAGLAARNVLGDIGRAHAELRIVGKNLAVRPIDEKHPVWVRRWRKMQLLGSERRLRHGDGFSSVGLRDTLVFGRHLELRRSGRSIAEAETLAAIDTSAGWRREATT